MMIVAKNNLGLLESVYTHTHSQRHTHKPIKLIFLLLASPGVFQGIFVKYTQTDSRYLSPPLSHSFSPFTTISSFSGTHSGSSSVSSGLMTHTSRSYMVYINPTVKLAVGQRTKVQNRRKMAVIFSKECNLNII